MSLRFYRNCTDETKEQCQAFKQEFEKLKTIATTNENKSEKLQFKHLCK